jgi:hypothetical protein
MYEARGVSAADLDELIGDVATYVKNCDTGDCP